MSNPETVKVVLRESGDPCIINKEDFNSELHELTEAESLNGDLINVREKLTEVRETLEGMTTKKELLSFAADNNIDLGDLDDPGHDLKSVTMAEIIELVLSKIEA